jgi:dissimilatory sulfite reductase (desulfoviridin) alpha/beta subunit
MTRPKIIAEVVEPGQCRYFRQGQRFALDGFTPAGLCASAYAALARDAQTMRCGGTLPWAKQGKVLTRCPDPQGALWQLQVESEAQTANAERDQALAAPKPSELEGYQLQPCRGFQGACPFALVKDASLAHQIDAAVRISTWWQRRSQRNGRALPHHLRMRLALAACPNACTMPQIRDVGIIATLTPEAIRPQCNGCGRCERVCREAAIAVHAGRAQLTTEKCVGCGQCIHNCPKGAIASGPVQLRILVGGRMGRHPRWAEDLCVVDPASAAAVVRAFLDCVTPQMRPGEPVANAVARMTVERLRQEVLAEARATSTEWMKCEV